MIVLAGFFLAVLTAAPLRADYLVTGVDGNTFRTDSYRIQGKKLHFSGERLPMDVYGIRSVTPEKLTPEEARAQEAAVDAFLRQVSQLEAVEKELLLGQAEALIRISAYPVGKRRAIDKGAKKELQAELSAAQEKALNLMNTWRDLKLPDFNLLKARDIKTLQLLSLESSIAQALRYVETDDPSYFEYARAHLNQSAAFDDAFLEALPRK